MDSKDIIKVVEQLTDNALAFMIVGSGVYQSLGMKMLYDWHIAAIGMVMAFFFVRIGKKILT